MPLRRKKKCFHDAGILQPRDLPKELWSVGVALAQQLLDAADVKSIKEGDVSVTFAESRAETELLADFRTELDRFRRADW